MFFKRNKNQESTDIDANQAQRQHKIETRYLVKLEGNTYIRGFLISGAIKSKDPRYMDMDFNRAKRTQREYGGVIYEVVTDECIRPYADGGISDQHVNDEAPIKTQEEIPDKAADLIKQLRNDGTPKPRVEANMATDVRLDDELVKSINALTEALSAVALSTVSQHEDNADKEHQPKIHELPEWQQPSGNYLHSHTDYYNVYINDPETVALLNEPNTRLAIIEDDEDETV